MDKISQEAYFRQRVLKYTEGHGVTAAADRYRMSRKTVYKWKNRYDGAVESLNSWRSTSGSRTTHHDLPGNEVSQSNP